MAPAWSAARAKVQLKLAIQRTKMLQEKMEAMQKTARKEISALIERGKTETARVKTEGLINTDIHIELIELMELYSETLLARFALLDIGGTSPDPSLVEPISAIIHAAPRTELRELHVLRELLMTRYGRDLSIDAMDNNGNVVSSRVMSKLKVETPSKELVDAYISEICKTYNVHFTSPYLSDSEPLVSPAEAEPPALDDGEKAADKGAAGTAKMPAAITVAPEREKPPTEQSALNSLEARFAALKR
ncbi:DUF292-domain-containing protein [Tilletiaria anomala UBC 951]|uniref:DUF292-domain-containing protein n=1 Tax=Tilletiaria anomala (strain ATCC 24038 / CBS 436.72 / UBC 951) TaxID=1037660 RepID=A0A066VWT5_TILAU|nr:DUF292-domain-containing protein [Tilletiaria anomala UBC 951]KDN43005.1 DUF292-domain-containing protein [Tilletiaria anomala UBC 951]